MKAQMLLMLLRAILSGYDQVLESIPMANTIVSQTNLSPIYTQARIDSVVAERARILAMANKLKALLDQEITIPEL